MKISPELSRWARADRAARPWLHPTTPEGDAFASSARAEQLAVLGVPFAVKVGVAIGCARRRDQLAAVGAHARAALIGGMISDDVSEAIDTAIKEKGEDLARWRGWWQQVAPPPVFNRVLDRRPRIQHRAKLAASGPMPPDLAKYYTTAELAVLKIVADEVFRQGTCRLSKKELSDRARASETTCHTAVRKAERLDMLSVKRRPVAGRKSLPNLILVIDKDWLFWIMRPKYRAIREDQQQARDAQQKQGANRRTPQSEHTYTEFKKSGDGVWKDPKEAIRISEPKELCPSRPGPSEWGG